MTTSEYSTFFELLPLGTYRCAPDATLLRVNREYALLHGYTDAQALIQSVGNTPFNPYENPEQLPQNFQTLLQTGQLRGHVSRCISRHTGALMLLRENVHLVRDADNKPLYYEGTAEDVSQEHVVRTELLQQESLLRALLQAIPDQVWLKNLYGNYLTCNDKYAEALGLQSSQIIGSVDADHPAAAIAAHYFVADESVIRRNRPICYEVEVRSGRKGGHETYEIAKAPVRSTNGSVTGVLGMARNITARKRSEYQLRSATEHLELALAGADLGRWEYDLQRQRGYTMDARAWQMLGYEAPPHKRAQRFGTLVHSDDLPVALHAIERHLEGHTPSLDTEYRALHQHGPWIWLSCRGKVVLRRSDGTALRMAGTLMDISRQKAADEALAHLAFHDPLTGLPNRRLLTDRLTRAVSASSRNRQYAAILYLDLDGFKQLNDQHGHSVGDFLLKEIAARLAGAVREVDSVARIGGDEFVVLINDLSEDPVNARIKVSALALKIMEHLRQPYQLGELSYTAQCSMGISLFKAESQTCEELLQQADAAMYQAKAAGRDTIRIFEPPDNQGYTL